MQRLCLCIPSEHSINTVCRCARTKSTHNFFKKMRFLLWFLEKIRSFSDPNFHLWDIGDSSLMLFCFGILLPHPVIHERFACQVHSHDNRTRLALFWRPLSATRPHSIHHALLPYPSLLGLLSAGRYSIRASGLWPEESRISTFGSGPAMCEKLREGRSCFPQIC